MNDLTSGGDGGGFSLTPANLKEAMQLAEMICNTEIVPKAFKGQAGDTLVAMMLGSELGLNPLYSLTNIAVINGRPSIYGDAMPALCQRSPDFEKMTETFDESTMTATCTVHRKGHEPHTVTFSQVDAVKAKLWDKGGVWTNYPKRMLQMRARGFALRDKFADALNGLITREEAQDIPVEKDITNESEIVNDNKPADSEPETIVMPGYTDEQFKENFPNLEALIKAGRKTQADIIYMVQSKYTLTDEQKKTINEVEYGGTK